MEKQNELLLNAITEVMIEAYRDEEEWSDYLQELLMVYEKLSPELYTKIINVDEYEQGQQERNC